ncbi:MAG: M23 family metallopeptidase [Acidobacteria bacterium]|nr:M23 family metallopeptidase [Acidobacteriota bacterium]
MKPVLALLVCCLALSWSVACRSNDAPPSSRSRVDIVLKPDTELIRGLVPRNTTLERLLHDHGLIMEAVHQVVAAARAVFDPRRLRATQPFVLERTLGGHIRHFEYEIDADTYLRVSRPSLWDEPRASVLPIPKQRHEVTAAGSISDTAPSLFQAMEAASEQPELAIAMAEIFAGEIDFNTEVQPGDRFGLAFEKFTRDERPATYGAIMAAEFQNDGRVLRAIRFIPPSGEPAYYDEHGRSLRRFFLRSPLKFEPRITSGFTRRRFHPVLEVHRPHLGVDYGAPTGAPVVAVASGTVVSATFDRRNGRMVRLRHARGYETYYLHLSAFGPGIRAGRRVSQGQVIGRVGSTGLATGPHLDYRLRKNGAFVNPVREHRNMPPGDPVPATARAAFEVAGNRALEMLHKTMQAEASDGEASPTASSAVTPGDETAPVRGAL